MHLLQDPTVSSFFIFGLWHEHVWTQDKRRVHVRAYVSEWNFYKNTPFLAVLSYSDLLSMNKVLQLGLQSSVVQAAKYVFFFFFLLFNV